MTADLGHIGSLQAGLGGIMLHDGFTHNEWFWITIGALWAILGFANIVDDWKNG